MSNPALGEINSVSGTTTWGTSVGPGQGLFSNMGLGGPALPGIEWTPRGANSALGAALAAMAGGIPPKQHGHIQLKSHDFLSQQYLTPPWGDESEKYIMPDMACFTLGATRAGNSMAAPNETVVLTLAALNQLLDSQWNELQGNLLTRPSDLLPADSESSKFWGYLTKYGEKWLETYHKQRVVGARYNKLTEKGLENAPWPADMEEYYQMAKKDFFCWFTRFGILSRVNWCGSVMNVNRGTSLEGYENVLQSQHYTQVVVGYAKRIRIANMFGEREHIDTGSKLWFTLMRKPDGAYCVVPGGSVAGWGSQKSRTYKDASGRPIIGHVWRIGIVSTPPTSYSTRATCDRAANLGSRVNEREAYEYHGGLPSMYVNMGSKW